MKPLLLTLDEGYLLTVALPALQHGIAPLGPPVPTQPRLLGHGVSPSHLPWPWGWTCQIQTLLLSQSMCLVISLLRALAAHVETVMSVIFILLAESL